MSYCNPRSLLMILVVLGLFGCSGHPRKVDCDGHLRPVNAPAPASKAGHP
jgi:hypothetical protein